MARRQLSHMSSMTSYCSDASYYSSIDNDYYNGDGDDDLGLEREEDDLEYFEYELLPKSSAERFLTEESESLGQALSVDPSTAKLLLHQHHWQTEEIQKKFRIDPKNFLVQCHVSCESKRESRPNSELLTECGVCYTEYPKSECYSVQCGHWFCGHCWNEHFLTQIKQGIVTGITCMSPDCGLLVNEEFLCRLLQDHKLKDKYSTFSFHEFVKSNPKLRFCPGADCSVIVKAQECKAKRVECHDCNTVFCFQCGLAYHMPTSCGNFTNWIKKAEDDSMTFQYIKANTKDCPACHVTIEKNGGCNHMSCYSCHHGFCWICLQDWSNHKDCNKYKESDDPENARAVLTKYLFYFERWEIHKNSSELETKQAAKLLEHTKEKVSQNEGTWIDWQYLLKSALLLKKCRDTLQYTYPCAYFMEVGTGKELFEYQQSQLEVAVENLSWKVERAEITDTGALQNQMEIVEKRRQTLLKHFMDEALDGKPTG